MSWSCAEMKSQLCSWAQQEISAYLHPAIDTATALQRPQQNFSRLPPRFLRRSPPSLAAGASSQSAPRTRLGPNGNVEISSVSLGCSLASCLEMQGHLGGLRVAREDFSDGVPGSCEGVGGSLAGDYNSASNRDHLALLQQLDWAEDLSFGEGQDFGRELSSTEGR